MATKGRIGSRESVGINTHMKRKESRDNNDGVRMATESPWLFVKGKKPDGERSEL